MPDIALFPGSSSTAANGPFLEPGAPGPVLSSDVVRVATAAGAKCFGRPDLIADQITIEAFEQAVAVDGARRYSLKLSGWIANGGEIDFATVRGDTLARLTVGFGDGDPETLTVTPISRLAAGSLIKFETVEDFDLENLALDTLVGLSFNLTIEHQIDFTADDDPANDDCNIGNNSLDLEAGEFRRLLLDNYGFDPGGLAP